MITKPGYRPEFHEESSCGSVVLAALLEVCCQEADMLMDLHSPKGWNGYTNVGHIRNVVEAKNIKMRKFDHIFVDGLAESSFKHPVALFSQLEGPWEEKGWRSAYSYTHWSLLLGQQVIDFNHRYEEDKAPRWFASLEWKEDTMQRLVEGTKGCTGWHIRAAYEFTLLPPPFERISVHNGEPGLIGNPQFESEELFGLRPGEQIIKIGKPAKSGKETSAHRVTEFNFPVTYSGTIRFEGVKYMAFSFVSEDGENAHLLWKFSRRFKELYLVNNRSLSIFIHDAVFERVA